MTHLPGSYYLAVNRGRDDFLEKVLETVNTRAVPPTSPWFSLSLLPAIRPRMNKINAMIKKGGYTGLSSDILSVIYARRWAEEGCFGAGFPVAGLEVATPPTQGKKGGRRGGGGSQTEVAIVTSRGLPREIVETIFLKAWDGAVDSCL